MRDVHVKHHHEGCRGLQGLGHFRGGIEGVLINVGGCHNGFWEHTVGIVFVDNPWIVCEKRTQK